MNDENDIELVIAQLLSEQDHSQERVLSREQTEQLAKAAKGLDALNHLADTQRGSTKTIDENAMPQDSQLPGDRIGRFEIKGTLGIGGHGIVFRAFDPQLEREVALKIPNINSALDKESQQRFLRESRAAAILSHPSIVPLFESGNIGPVHYIAYKYCPGSNLSEWNKLHSFRSLPQLAAEVIAQLADAVEHAHQRGVVHRDLKPSNLLLESEPGTGSPAPEQLPSCLRITDFGLAKFTSDSSSLTRTRAIVGTPEYMSPEQAEGASNVGKSSDIYSLGAILFELLTGQPPHRKETLIATLKSVSNDPVTSPRKSNPRVSHDLAAVCMKCLEKNPNDRYLSAHQLGDDLRSVVEHRPVSVAKPTIARKMEKWIQRNPILVRAAIVSAMTTILTLLVALYWVNEARQNERDANQTAQENLQRAREIVKDFFVMTENELADLPGDSSIRNALATKSLRYFEEFEQLVDNHDLSTMEDLAKVRARLGRILDSNQQFDVAILHLTKALGEFKSLANHPFVADNSDDKRRYRYQIARIKVDLGSAYTNMHQRDQGRSFNQQAVEELTQLHQSSPTKKVNDQLINALIDQSTILTASGETETAQSVQRKTLSLMDSREMTISLKRKRAFLLLEMAKTSAVRQELNESREHYQNAKQNFLEVASQTKQNQFLQLLVAKCQIRIIDLDQRLGRPNQDSLESRVQIVNQLGRLADSNPERPAFQFDYAMGLSNLAQHHANENRLNEAIEINRKLIQFLEATEKRIEFADAEGKIILGGGYNNLALCYVKKKRFEIAEDAIRAAIPNTQYATEKEPNNLTAKRFLINHYYGLGEILTTLERPEEAIDAFGEAIELSIHLFSTHPVKTAQHSQLHAILGKRLSLMRQFDHAESPMMNLKARILQGSHLHQNGQDKFLKYYDRELDKDLNRLISHIIQKQIDDTESIITPLLNSDSRPEGIKERIQIILERIQPTLTDPRSNEILGRIQEIVDSHQ